MAIVKRKSRLHHQISFDPFLLFVISSIALHGLVVLGLVFFKRSPISELEEATPIDFVVVPPEESPAEPPPDTELQADKSSVAQGNVEPKLPTKSDRVDSQEAVATPTSPAQAPPAVVPPTPPPATPTPQPQAEVPPPVTPPSPPEEAKAIENPSATPPKEIEPNSPVEKALPSEPQPLPEPTETASNPPPLPKEPKPTANKPPLSGSDTSISVPEETFPTAESPFKTDFPSKSEETEPLPELEETPATAENTFKTENPSKLEETEPLPKLEKTPPAETENPSEPDSSPVATNPPPTTPTEPPSTPTPPENTSVPETPTSESQTAVGSGSASLLEGTESKSSEDSESTFFDPEANASEQAVNSSGVDARANVDLGPYLAEVKQRVRQNWQTPTVDDNRQTVIVFAIERNGQITGLQIKQSSGSPEVDNKFLAAIEKSAPFAPLPANYPNSHLNIVYDLNINMYVR